MFADWGMLWLCLWMINLTRPDFNYRNGGCDLDGLCAVHELG